MPYEIAQALADAVAQERERCAVVAETRAAVRCGGHQLSGKGVCGYEIAAALRAGADA